MISTPLVLFLGALSVATSLTPPALCASTVIPDNSWSPPNASSPAVVLAAPRLDARYLVLPATANRPTNPACSGVAQPRSSMVRSR